MKIIHVISGLTKGGGERVAVELANKSVDNGDEVTLLAGWPVDPSFLQNDVNSNIAVKFVSNKRIFAYLYIIPFLIKNKFWINTNDIIHCHLTFGGVFGYMANLLLRNKKFKVVETYHAVGMHIPKFNRWLHSKLMLLKDGVVFMANDSYWDNFVKNNKRLKSAIIPNGIKLLDIEKNKNKKADFPSNFSISKHTNLVGTIGMLRPDRKPSLYITVFKFIKDFIKEEVHFILGGDGIEFQKIKDLRDETNLVDCFHMIGLVSNPEEIFSKLDIYVSVSVGKTTGISMIEAAMCKIPVVGIQLLEGYKADESDWVWSHTDLKKVAERIVFLLKNQKEREQLIEEQYDYVVNNLTSDAMYSSYKSFYKKVLN